MKLLNRLIIFLLLMSGLAGFQVCYADPPLPTPVARVVWVKGVFKAIMANNEVRVLQKASVVYEHDKLITESNAEAQIVFTDETLMTFRPDTTFIVDEYAYNPKAKNGSVGKYIMNLLEGGFRTITGLIAKNNPADYQVNTPVATIGVRGTDYVAYVHNGELYVGFYHGQPCVSNKQGELCLDDKTQYANVNGENKPTPVTEQPAVFKTKLEVVPAAISPFSTPGTTTYENPNMGTVRGPITSFCITQ